MPVNDIPGREILENWKNLQSATWLWETEARAWKRSNGTAIWHSGTHTCRRRKGNAGLMVEPAEPGISGLKSLVQSVKGKAERNAIVTALDQARWNRKAAARLLKVSYRTLLYKIEQYHMSPPPSHFSGYGDGHSSRERKFHNG